MTQRKDPPVADELDPSDPHLVRPPEWHDKHGRPELRMPRSFVTGEVEPLIMRPSHVSEDADH